MSRLALIVILIIVAVGVTLQYFADDLRSLLDVAGRKPPATEVEDSEHSASETRTKVVESPVEPVEEQPSIEIEPVPPSEEELVRDIVERRYPTPELPPFEQIVGDWTRLSPRVFPQRVTVAKPVELSESTASGVVARAHVVAGGSVRPVSLNGDRLSVESLARAQLTAVVPVGETDFKDMVEERYRESLRRAKQRVEVQREVDFEWLSARAHVVRRIVATERLWDDLDDSRHQSLRESISAGRAGAARLRDLDQLFFRGPETYDEPEIKGQFDTVLVCFQFDDAGFGNLPYYSKCLLRRTVVVRWIDPVPAWDAVSH